ncbi:MAG: YggS family pyridoxal phosphate-dependent enzyme [Actinomycetaceae bacterium]|nr:YggS family pyridoxal phosphate-dependent enzyme [Actinomycetaceae bacterium]
MSDSIRSRLDRVLARIDTACASAGRRPDDVRLMLAVKHRSVEDICLALEGLVAARRPLLIGQNHVQQARASSEAVRERYPEVEIHLIGHLQTNKITQALACVDAIDTLDSQRVCDKIASRLNTPLPVMVEVNVSEEDSKTGCPLDEARPLIERVLAEPHLSLRGLMTVGVLSENATARRAAFARLARLKDEFDPSLELSMGMSGDLAEAIAEGASIVRIGTDVFGPRPQ